MLLALLTACGPSELEAADLAEAAYATPSALDPGEWKPVDSFTIVRSTGVLTSTTDCAVQIAQHCASICEHRYYEPREHRVVYLLDFGKRYDLCRIEGGIRHDSESARTGLCRVYQRVETRD